MGVPGEKSSVPSEIANIIRARLILECAHSMSEEILEVTEEVIIQSLKKDHGLSEATAKKYYDDILKELMKKDG